MSNKRKLRRLNVACPDCGGRPSKPRLHENGITQVIEIEHKEGCPVVTGQVTDESLVGSINDEILRQVNPGEVLLHHDSQTGKFQLLEAKHERS